MAIFLRAPDTVLPWASSVADDKRYFKILGISLAIFLLFALVVPFLPVKEITREQKEALPPQLARVILEKKELPKPEPIKPKPKPKPKEEKKPEPEKPKEKPKEKPVEKPKPKPEPKPVDKLQEAKDKAAVSGMLAFQDDLAEMRDSVDLDTLSNSNLTRADQEAAKVERSIITSKAKASSGGIQTAALSRDTGGVALSGKEDTKVGSSFDQIAKNAAAKSGSKTSGAAGGRSDESVRRVMDKNKGAIFAIYNRALRKDPTLEGKFVFEMLIQPNGSISEVKLISSALNNPELERKILNRIRLIRFPAADVIKTRVNYSFDFLPY